VKRSWVITVVVLSLFISLSGRAQDIHFSQFFATPLFTNPALTGHFQGTYRFTGVVRRQWSSISPQPFQTLGGGVELNAPFNLKNLGIDLQLGEDITGASALSTFQANLMLATRFWLGSAKDVSVSLGAHAGLSNQSIDYSKLQFDNQFNGIRYYEGMPTGESFGVSRLSWKNLGAGVFIEKKFTSRKYIGVGYSVFNLLTPGQSYMNNSGVTIDMRHNLHVMASFDIARKWDFLPGAQVMLQGPHAEVLAGGAFKYHLANSATEQRSVQMGIWGRPGDAGYLSAGMNRNNLFVGASYDFNLSTLRTASNYLGGWELTLINTIETVREKVKRVRQCPDYL